MFELHRKIPTNLYSEINNKHTGVCIQYFKRYQMENQLV